LYYGLPALVSFTVGITLALLLQPPVGYVVVVWWLIVMAASFVALLLTERCTRRLLSLSMLLRLSLAFPNEAPSRLAIALRSGSLHQLRRMAANADAHGVEPTKRLEAVVALATALNTHDRRTRGHSERVRALTDLLAAEMGIDGDAADKLRWAALLHDIGKLSVPAAVLNKPGAPNDREWALLRKHPEEGARIVTSVAPWLGEAASAIDGHHERWNGPGGYPRGTSGTDIPLSARIVAVTDAFETMTAVRSYKKPMRAGDAREELARCAGTQFDPDVVRAFLRISLPRVNRAIGIAAWIAQVPVIGLVPRIAAQAAVGGGAVAAASPQLIAAGSAVLGAVAGPAIVTSHVEPAAAATPPATASAPAPPTAAVPTEASAPVPANAKRPTASKPPKPAAAEPKAKQGGPRAPAPKSAPTPSPPKPAVKPPPPPKPAVKPPPPPKPAVKPPPPPKPAPKAKSGPSGKSGSDSGPGSANDNSGPGSGTKGKGGK
jgi:putative nucleotidyltransferase with HDIG domain